MTAYDAYGRPQAVVDPGVALAGAALVGVAALALASDDDWGGRSCHRPPVCNSRPFYGNRGGCRTGYHGGWF